MRYIYLLMSVITLILFSSCSNNDDITNAVNKDGAIETSVTVNHLDSLHDILITKHKVWVNNNEYKNLAYTDTIPALGKQETVAENKDGDTKKVSVKKDYEIFITVK